MTGNIFNYDTVSLTNDKKGILIVDQTKLPNHLVFTELRTLQEIAGAICTLKVRGAPAIGIAASFAISAMLNSMDIHSVEELINEFNRLKSVLTGTRPTAVNLINSLNRLETRFHELIRESGADIKSICRELLDESEKIKRDDIDANIKIAENAFEMLNGTGSVMTVCNAGHLAVSRYGTALAPFYLSKSRGREIKVFACETRPLLQGARLTAFELMKAGIDVTLICDNMAATVMAQGRVDAVITGCDRIAKNGDTANKIGTLMLAVLAKHFNIPFYVAGPSSTIDLSSNSGSGFVIEERSPEEITQMWYKERMAPEGVNVYNPAFDITPAELISAVITEKGVFKFPYNF